jgi:hypothetical protein
MANEKLTKKRRERHAQALLRLRRLAMTKTTPARHHPAVIASEAKQSSATLAASKNWIASSLRSSQ